MVDAYGSGNHGGQFGLADACCVKCLSFDEFADENSWLSIDDVGCDAGTMGLCLTKDLIPAVNSQMGQLVTYTHYEFFSTTRGPIVSVGDASQEGLDDGSRTPKLQRRDALDDVGLCHLLSAGRKDA